MNLSPKVINLADYTKPNFEVNNVYLDFQIRQNKHNCKKYNANFASF